jgi:DNA helicase-4
MVTLSEDSLIIKNKAKEYVFKIQDRQELRVSWRWFSWRLSVDGNEVVNLRGAGRRKAKFISLSLELCRAASWHKEYLSIREYHWERQIWIPREKIDYLKESRPDEKICESVYKLKVQSQLDPTERNALDFLSKNLELIFKELNDEIVNREFSSQEAFFASIESRPLSYEQALATITFDNRVLLVAAAGSGKTSVMIARAAYSTLKKIVEPSRILMLAYNKVAADELGERVKARFQRAKLESNGIKCSTFHAFGLDVLGKALGSRPRVAPWVDKNREIEEIDSIAKELQSKSKDFKYKWDLYKHIFTPDTLKIVDVEPDSWDSDSRERGFRTFDGKLVRSHGERMICNWLYLHGVKYEYEREYSGKSSSSLYRQYTPDFYYPDIDVWHEHWALDESGKAPSSFSGYLEQISWKKSLHFANKTKLIETTFGDVVFSDGLTRLKNQLISLGIEFDWNPDRPKAEFTEVQDASILTLIRSFMTHIKSNSLSREDVENRLTGEWKHLASERTNIFLSLFWPIHEEWNLRLEQTRSIDFEDMLISAAIQIENGSYTPEFDLILVDEFQDSSAARGRLINSLIKSRGKYVLAVGDDWQSINRFAGADLSQMTNYHRNFGNGPTLMLSRTYRCTQRIADVSSQFVSKNPEQIKKRVEAESKFQDFPVVLVRTLDQRAGVHDVLTKLADQIKSPEKASVFILGRYNFNEDWVPSRSYRNLDISFRTIHSSKGLEADYVVIVNCEAGRYGFPSEIEDDPVLNLAMSRPDKFEFAEERRLLYVGLTRARRQVFMVTRQGRDSIFAAELISDGLVNVVSSDFLEASESEIHTCSKCQKGIMNVRSGRYGKFLGCSRFPKCDHTMTFSR